MSRIASLALAVLAVAASADLLHAQQGHAAGSPEEAVARTIQLLEEERWEEAASMADPVATEQLFLQARCEIYMQRRSLDSQRDPARAAQLATLFGPAAQRRYLEDNFGVQTLEELEALTPEQALERHLSLKESRLQNFKNELMLAMAAMTALPQMSSGRDSIIDALTAARPPQPPPEIVGHVARGDTAFVVLLQGASRQEPQVERVFRQEDGWRLALDGPVFQAPVSPVEAYCPEIAAPQEGPLE